MTGKFSVTGYARLKSGNQQVADTTLVLNGFILVTGALKLAPEIANVRIDAAVLR
jgi:hypothetical protein